MKTKKCPVCGVELQDPPPDFCPTAGCRWDLRNDLTIVPSLDLPDAAISDYHARLNAARQNWEERLQLVEDRKSFEERLASLEKMQSELLEALEKSRQEERHEEKTSEKKAVSEKQADKLVASARSEKSRDEDVTPPSLERDVFETVEEFEVRIDSHGPFCAGSAKLIRDRYDIESGRFPVEISWKIDPEKLVGIPAADEQMFILAERDTARALWDNGPEYPVFLSLEAKKERACVRNNCMVWQESEFQVLTPYWVEPVTGMELVCVPGGTFLMGDIFGEGQDDEKPLHEVRLDSFYIGKYPVVQGQWKKIMGSNNPSYFQKSDDYPVERVSWEDARAFIERLSKINGGCYQLCLPTEAQWEYAARSGGKRERYAGGDDIGPFAWYERNSNGSTQTVGMKQPNGLGIFDMSGNVWEWCEDQYDKRAYDKHGEENPVCCSGAGSRAARGGAWSAGAKDARCGLRGFLSPESRHSFLGFRLARKI